MKWLPALLMFLPLTAVATPASLLPTRVEAAIRARIQAGEYPTLVVAVVDGDKGHVYAFGKLANGKTPTADTIYQIGSVTKTFTATLLALAIEQGKVKLDTPVTSLLPGLSVPQRDGKPITLGELAAQFSGLPRLPTNLQPANDRDPYADYDVARLKAFLAGYALPRDPGSAYEYSNLGLGLLGYALAQRAGTTYGKLVQSQIFTPLGMTSSTTTFALPLGARWAHGHAMDGSTTPPWHLDVLAGAGVINSTGADMLRYLEANMGRAKGNLGKAMRLAQAPRRDVGKDERIGLAWMTRHAKAGDVVWHNGMTGGYASFMGFTADGRRGVVVLTNVQASVDDLGIAVLLPDSPLAPATHQIHMDAAALDAYVGQYQLAPQFIITVRRHGDQLYAQATGQGAFPIFPQAANEFFAKVADIRISFQRGKDRKVASLILRQEGHTSAAAPRLDRPAAESPTPPQSIQLDSTTLAQYVGRYQLAPDVIFDVTLKDGQLMVQLTGQSSFPVYASAKDELFYTVVDAQLSFKRGADGKVDALVLHQNGANQRAARISSKPEP